jgi:hypothetical protein
MSNLDIELQRTGADEPDYLAVVRVSDGRQFKLGILKSVLDVWHDQVGDLDVDAVASKLAQDILEQQPSPGNMDEGFLVTLENGYATPVAAEQNLRNSGVLPFLDRQHGHVERDPQAAPRDAV